MAYSGKAAYDSLAISETADDVSDFVSINSKVEVPLLDFFGDPPLAATSTLHEWLEDDVLTNVGQMAEALDNSETDLSVDDGTRYRVGDLILIDDEVMLVTVIATNDLTVSARGYGSSTAATHLDDAPITILGNAALEGGDADAAKSTVRGRKDNRTQIIRPATINVSFTEQSVSQIGVANEYEHQKAQRVVEAMRMLENLVINGRVASSTPQGSGTIRRTMKGFKEFCSSNVTAAGSVALTETYLNSKLESAWNNGAYDLDFIAVGATQKRKISQFITPARRYTSSEEAMKSRVGVYESDFGNLVVILDRWVSSDQVLFGSSKWIKVLPLQGRSFQHYPLARSGDYDKGIVQGEYTLEMRHEEAHGYIDGLSTS